MGKKNTLIINDNLNETILFIKMYKIFSTYFAKIRFKKSKQYKRRFFNIKRLDMNLVINLLKIPSKFQYISEKFFNYCRVYFKFTGSNIFLTITNNKGDVKFSYSSGIFKGVRIR